MNGMTAGAAFLVSSFWDITQNHGACTHAVAAVAMHALRLVGIG